MTIAEAREKLETLTRNLASSEISCNQRQNCEAQMAQRQRRQDSAPTRFVERARSLSTEITDCAPGHVEGSDPASTPILE